MRDFANSRFENVLVKATGHAGLGMAFAAVLAFLSPFGTYRFDPIERIGYWTLQMAGWVTLAVLTGALLARVPWLRGASVATRRIATTMIAALPMLVVTGFSNNILHGWQPYPGEVIELYVSILFIGGVYVFASQRLLATLLTGQAASPLPPSAAEPGGDGGGADASEGGAEGPSDPALLERLPAHLRADILCLQVEDHYVRIHSAQGSAMVLMRFSDAIRGLDHLTGAQVHRSWWVAAGAVKLFRRSGRTAQLILINEMIVPVSQPYVADAAGRWGDLEAEVAA